jgi:hypothetical protein
MATEPSSSRMQRHKGERVTIARLHHGMHGDDGTTLYDICWQVDGNQFTSRLVTPSHFTM